ncbi:MAG: single-stranded-DNA-specific exonuclease RecJ [Firmicutes bacterium]|nr:single-stranded-DNA-specific exonuclease RecJ [Bacillota bacterium]
MRERIWEFKNRALKPQEILDFALGNNIPPAIATILLNRDIRTEEQVRSYLKKELAGVHNPFLFDGMEAAADRIVRAISENEPVVVYGDYDVDGITSTALLYSFLKSRGANVEYYIPDRKKEGYGINIMAVNRLARRGIKLMITVDCGITAVGEIEFAKTQGMEVIVTDHHTCKEDLPRAVAVINPKIRESSYPFDGLAGVGVAFKLVLALAVRLGLNTKAVFMQYAEIAAVGTIADVVPLVDENRIIVDKGIISARQTKNNGLRALIEVSGINGSALSAMNVAFAIAPRLNVAGRLESADTAVRLLIEEDYDKALEIARHLNSLNTERQRLELDILNQAMNQAESFGEDERLVYVMEGEGWNSGVIGIVASRVLENFYRPCVLISCENGKGKGSGRSIEGFNLFDALTACSGELTEFGGHSLAAGLSIEQDKIAEFRKKINEYAKKNMNSEMLVPKLKIECVLEKSDITMNAAKIISRLEPFGMGNDIPVFAAYGLKVLHVSCIGTEGKHLRLLLGAGGRQFRAVGFGMGELAQRISVGQKADIAFTMSVNIYQNNENLQLLLKDIKFDGNI